MLARQLRKGDRVPGGVVAGVEVHTGKVLVWLTDGRIWVYDWADDMTDVRWFIGESLDATHRPTHGPFGSRFEADAVKAHYKLEGDVFALPKAHHRKT